MTEDMIYRVSSRKKIADVARDLEAASGRHKFGILGVHDLKSKLKEKGVDYERECLIFEVCNPQQAKRVLEKNAEISTALPCRISLYGEGEMTTLATLRPTALLALYSARGLEPVAREVEESLMRIMQEAAR